MPNMQLFAVLEVDTVHDTRNYYQTKAGRDDFAETPAAWSAHHARELGAYNLSVEAGTLAFVDHDSSFVHEFFDVDGVSCRVPGGLCLNHSLALYPPARGRWPGGEEAYWKERSCQNEALYEVTREERKSHTEGNFPPLASRILLSPPYSFA
jgi:hypothetical protein